MSRSIPPLPRLLVAIPLAAAVFSLCGSAPEIASIPECQAAPGAAEGPRAKEEPAAPEMRTVEGSPEGGFTYRLAIPAGATLEKPARLVIWLHPSARWMTALDPLAPIFTRNGFALLVVTGKQTTGWTDREAARLLGRTLPDAAEVAGVDAARPILFGFSAGGQLALALWQAKPGRYGGLILDAAYPVERKDDRHVAIDLPSDPAVREVPLFVLVGLKDPVAVFWRQVEGPWREAGVPLTVRYVPGKGHELLLGDEEIAALDAWLGRMGGR